jgi:hypothetical protein
VWQFALPILIAAVPLLAWSLHNDRVYGFFGISDYGGAALYDGWIYYGESSGMHITDAASGAVQAINAAYPPRIPARSEQPTSWTVYYALMQRGYKSEQAFSILQHATLDSVRQNPLLAWRLLGVKLQQGFEPNPFIPGTFPLPGETSQGETLNAGYFDKEPLLIPALIPVQQFVNGMLASWYRSIFTVWFWLGLVMIFIALYRHPAFAWIPLVAIVANSIFLPTIAGMSMWRYVLFGLVLMPIFILSGVQSAGEFLSYYWNALSTRKSNAAYKPPQE